MKKEQLIEIGLSEEQIEKVFEWNGKDIQKHKDLTAERDSEIEELKMQLTNRDKDLKELQKSAKGNEELQSELTSLREKYTEETKALNDKLATVQLHNAIDKELTASKARNLTAIKALLDFEKIKLEDGKLTGLTEQITVQRKDNPFLFEGEKEPSYEPNAGGRTGYPDDIKKALETKNFNLTKFLEEKGE